MNNKVEKMSGNNKRKQDRKTYSGERSNKINKQNRVRRQHEIS